MAVTRANEMVEVIFDFGDRTYQTSIRRGQILHEAYHRAIPSEYTAGRRLSFTAPDGHVLYADNFAGDIQDRYGAVRLQTRSEPILGARGPWRNIGSDHLALAVADRAGARDFFREVVGMQIMRDDEHITVMATGPTALFLFDANTDAPLSPGGPSSIHHIGFVVDNLEHAYAHLRDHEDRLQSDFTFLDRNERWSLYFHYRNGDVQFMIQFSQVKEAERGFLTPGKKGFANYLYDYTSQPYGLQFGETGEER